MKRRGAVLRFADGSDLTGDVFGWIEILRNLSTPGFNYDADNPFHTLMRDVSPFQLTQLLDLAIRSYPKQIRKRKEIECDCQALEIACMVEQAYIAGAREMLWAGIAANLVPPDKAEKAKKALADKWDAIWRYAAHTTYEILARINANVNHRGRKSRPPVGEDVSSLKGMIDEEILSEIHVKAPLLELASEEYAAHMRDGIPKEVRRFIRLGKLAGGDDNLSEQEQVDKHSKRLRHRLEAYLAKFRTAANG